MYGELAIFQYKKLEERVEKLEDLISDMNVELDDWYDKYILKIESLQDRVNELEKRLV